MNGGAGKGACDFRLWTRDRGGSDRGSGRRHRRTATGNHNGKRVALPSGPFEQGHRSLQTGLRAWVEEQTRHPLGYVEQLYTFADRDRMDGATAQHTVSISYLGLTREGKASGPEVTGWRNWYDYFPWEDHRAGRPVVIEREIGAYCSIQIREDQRALRTVSDLRRGVRPFLPTPSRRSPSGAQWRRLRQPQDHIDLDPRDPPTIQSHCAAFY